MKYIDADRLKAEIERRKQSLRAGICSDDAFTKEQKKEMLVASEEKDRFNRIIDSLQQEQPGLPQIERAEYYYHKGVYEGLSQGRADALKMLDEFMKRNANPVIVIKQQEQPEVDLEKELDKFYGMYRKDGKTYDITDDEEVSDWKEDGNSWFKIEFARHFYELGLKSK